MATKKQHAAPHIPLPVELKLRTEKPGGPVDPSQKRFDIFLIDTGWNHAISEMVRKHLPLIYEYQKQDSLYLLTPAQSIEVLKHDTDLIGHDPTIIFYDRYASGSAGSYRGFRLNLGLLRNAEQALARLQEFIRFVAANRAAEHLERCVRRELHREGVEGIIKLLRETSTDLLME
jgi:hypothetical protein